MNMTQAEQQAALLKCCQDTMTALVELARVMYRQTGQTREWHEIYDPGKGMDYYERAERGLRATSNYEGCIWGKGCPADTPVCCLACAAKRGGKVI